MIFLNGTRMRLEWDWNGTQMGPDSNRTQMEVEWDSKGIRMGLEWDSTRAQMVLK